MLEPTFQPDDIERILQLQREAAEQPDASDPAWPWFTGILIAFTLVVTAIAGLTSLRDDVRETRRAVQEVRPCRP